MGYLFDSYRNYNDAMLAGEQLAREHNVGYKILSMTSKEYPWGVYLDREITKRTCRYHEKTELDEAGECPKCLDEAVEYGKERAKGKVPVNSPLLQRAMANSGQGGWFKDSRRHSVAARKGKDKLRMAYLKKKR